MRITLLKSKLLRAEVTDRALHYEGSLAMDADFMEAVGLRAYEKILVANISNGERFETYAIEAPRGSHCIALNGAAAHKGELGDLLVIMAFGDFEAHAAGEWKPQVLLLSDGNRSAKLKQTVLLAKDTTN